MKSLFKKAVKILDKKSISFHHCPILRKYRILSFDHFKRFKLARLHKILHGIAPPPLGGVHHVEIQQQWENNQSLHWR